MRRGPCFGTCPVYAVTVSSDGRVQWRGREFVRTIGESSWQVPARTVRKIESALRRCRFLRLKNMYSRVMITCMPSCKIEVEFADGSFKVVDHYYGDFSAPRRLSRLERRIDKLLETNGHIGPR